MGECGGARSESGGTAGLLVSRPATTRTSTSSARLREGGKEEKATQAKGACMPPAATKDEALAVLFDISQLLETGLDRESLGILVELTESGVNPEALAAVVKELRRESAALRDAEANASKAAL